jgi:DNA-directed RNA polymerase beta' subunit
MRYKIVLSLPSVDYVRTVSNNLWDIYYTFGIEATRHFMIEQMLKIMPGINKCHIQLLIDKMVFGGIPTSISRYSMRGEGTFARVSFEETLDNFLKSASEGQCEPISGVSASVICGKPASMGTGLCEIVLDMEKLKSS